MHRTPLLIAATLALVTLALAQPSLTPPAGPIEESGRIGLGTEINSTTAPPSSSALHVITEPGSYYLSGDIEAGSRNGIEIAASNVTIDLNGFTIRGNGAAAIAPLNATNSTDTYTGTIIRNGHISGFNWAFLSFDQEIVDVRGFAAFTQILTGTRLEDIVAEDCELGFEVRNGVVESCVIHARRRGITAIACTVTDTQVTFLPSSQAFKRGIVASASTLSNCTVDSVSASEDLDLRAIELINGNCHACTTRGAGIGFYLGANTVANSCASFNFAGNTVLAGAVVNNSNF